MPACFGDLPEVYLAVMAANPTHMSDDWTDEELRASVHAYLDLQAKDRAGEAINKRQVYGDLSQRYGRTPKSNELRMRNISYVMSLVGREWLSGLMPAANVGVQVGARIEAMLAERLGVPIEGAVAFAIAAKPQKSLNATPPAGVGSPTSKQTTVTTYARSAAVRSWVLTAARGSCEGCAKPAPFETADGPFLEVHHLRRLADLGSDSHTNAVALCPNCHRELHFGLGAHALRTKLYATISRLRPE